MALVNMAYEVPRAGPVTIVVADQTPSNTNNEFKDCNCGVQPGASKAVRAVSVNMSYGENIGFQSQTTRA